MQKEESGRTLVCSVLFIDIAGYSKRSVSEQFEIKQRFNGILGEALEVLKRHDRVLVDTGDGAAVVFLGDPEDALVVGLAVRELAGNLQLRLGINLGPVRLMSDLNDQVNVIGDGINVAQRVMSFAEPGELLVSANYHDVVSRLSDQYAKLFTSKGRRQDKHVREHELYSVSRALRITREPLLEDLPEPAVQEPVKVLDAGASLMISGPSRAAVAAEVDRLVRQGCAVVSAATLVGNRWIASCTRPGGGSEVKVEAFGLTRVITGADREAVSSKAAELVAYGARVVRDVELVEGVWTAVCDTRA